MLTMRVHSNHAIKNNLRNLYENIKYKCYFDVNNWKQYQSCLEAEIQMCSIKGNLQTVPEKQLLLKSLTRSTINTCQEGYFQVVIEKKLPQRYFL